MRQLNESKDVDTKGKYVFSHSIHAFNIFIGKPIYSKTKLFNDDISSLVQIFQMKRITYYSFVLPSS